MGNISDLELEEAEPMNMDFAPVPKGMYQAKAVNSEVKNTNAGDGMYVKYEFELLEPGFAGKKVWHNFTLKNSNPKAEQIGKGTLAKFTEVATGSPGLPNDSSDLHDLPVILSLDIKESPGYEPQNVVKGFYLVDKKGNTDAAKYMKANVTRKAVKPEVGALPESLEDDELPF